MAWLGHIVIVWVHPVIPEELVCFPKTPHLPVKFTPDTVFMEGGLVWLMIERVALSGAQFAVIGQSKAHVWLRIIIIFGTVKQHYPLGYGTHSRPPAYSWCLGT